jgi:hypothetical protein
LAAAPARRSPRPGFLPCFRRSLERPCPVGALGPARRRRHFSMLMRSMPP